MNRLHGNPSLTGNFFKNLIEKTQEAFQKFLIDVMSAQLEEKGKEFEKIFPQESTLEHIKEEELEQWGKTVLSITNAPLDSRKSELLIQCIGKGYTLKQFEQKGTPVPDHLQEEGFAAIFQNEKV